MMKVVKLVKVKSWSF